MRDEQRAIERRLKFKAAEGVMDFFGVLGCALLIVALVALIANLYSWLVADLTQSFADLQKSVSEALIVSQ